MSERLPIIPFVTAPGEAVVHMPVERARRELQIPLIFPLTMAESPSRTQEARRRAKYLLDLSEDVSHALECPPITGQTIPLFTGKPLESQNPIRMLQPDMPFSIASRVKAPIDRIPLDIAPGEDMDREIGDAAPRFFQDESYSERQSKISAYVLTEGAHVAVDDSLFSKLHNRMRHAAMTPAQKLRANVLEAMSHVDERILSQHDRNYIIRRLVQVPNAGNRNGGATVLGYLVWKYNMNAGDLSKYLTTYVSVFDLTFYDIIRYARMWMDVMRLPEPVEASTSSMMSIDDQEYDDDDVFDEFGEDEFDADE